MAEQSKSLVTQRLVQPLSGPHLPTMGSQVLLWLFQLHRVEGASDSTVPPADAWHARIPRLSCNQPMLGCVHVRRHAPYSNTLLVEQ